MNALRKSLADAVKGGSQGAKSAANDTKRPTRQREDKLAKHGTCRRPAWRSERPMG
jgi:hypothetical protein